MVLALPDQKFITIVNILVHEVFPLIGVPESLLPDQETNMLSFIMKDVCNLLGIDKLNTMASHPNNSTKPCYVSMLPNMEICGTGI